MALFTLPPKATVPGAYPDFLNFVEGNVDPDITLTRRTLLPEWYPQSGVQLTWPHAATDWAYMLPEVTECYLRLAFEIARREPLLIVAPEPEPVERLLREKLPAAVCDNIVFAACPTNDTWARDHAFLTVGGGSAGLELLDFRFNGWGDKFESNLDNAINRTIFDKGHILGGTYADCLDFCLEGGSIETDGRGTLLTTAQCLLNPNRNPQYGQSEIEELLARRLGVNHFLWITDGYLAGDDTDSHIDTLARLCPDNTILYVKCADPSDEHYAALRCMEEQIKAFRTPEGEPYRLITVPMPPAAYDEEGERLPATYANYLVMDKAV
ncbi:MAG: agmatine deiminase family protein, partial [Alloprevotella sp.]